MALSFSPEELQAIRAQAQNERNTSIKPPKKQRGRGGTLTSLISEGGAAGGAAAGAAAGSVVGPAGTLLGALIGGAAGGFSGRLAENKIRDNEFRVEDAVKEGAISGLTAVGPLNALKGVKAARAGRNIPEAMGVVGAKKTADATAKKGVVGKLQDRAAASYFKLTPSDAQKLLDQGVNPTDLAKRAAQMGKTPDQVIGATDRGGPLAEALKAQESRISAVTSANKNTRLSGEGIVKQLQDQRNATSSQLGEAPRRAKLDEVIEEAKAKYANGFDPVTGRNTLRDGNMRFGESVLNDTGDAVAKAAQKTETNEIRRVLKKEYPQIEDALDEEAALMQIRGLSERARAVQASGKLGRTNRTATGLLLDPILNSGTLTSAILKAGGGGAKQAASQANGKLAAALQAGTRSATNAPLAMGARAATGSLAPKDESIEGEVMPDETQNPDAGIEQDPQADPNDIFNPANSEAVVEQILSNGGNMKHVEEYLDMLGTMQKLSPTGNVKKTESQRARDDAAALTDQAIAMFDSGKIKTGLIGANVERAKSFFSMADQSTEDFNVLSQNLRATIAKARAGTAMSEGEKRLLNQYTPVVGDSRQQLETKLRLLQATFSASQQREYGTEYQPDLISALGAQ